jgi:hypothetical protein
LPILADATISQYNSSEEKMNFGGSVSLKISGGKSRKTLIKADLSSAPQNRELLKASLQVFVLKISYPSSPMLLAFKVMEPWSEGTKSWGVFPDGVTWLEHDYIDHDNSTTNNWMTSGGDFDRLSNHGYGANGLIKRASATVGEWISIDITPVVQEWIDNPNTNHGLLLRGIMRSGNFISIASKDNDDKSLAPKIEYHYAGDPVEE